MAMDEHEHEHDTTAPARTTSDAAAGAPGSHAARRPVATPTTVILKIDVQGGDPDRLSDVIGRIVAMVVSVPNMTVDAHVPDDQSRAVQGDDLQADDGDDDPLNAFPAEQGPSEAGRHEQHAVLHAQPGARDARRDVNVQKARSASAPPSHEETGFEWRTQPAAGPLVRHESRDATPARPTLPLHVGVRAAIMRAWTLVGRACSHATEQTSALGARARTAARHALAHARSQRARRFGGAVGAGAVALTLAVALVALAVATRVHPTSAVEEASRALARAPAQSPATQPSSRTGAPDRGGPAASTDVSVATTAEAAATSGPADSTAANERDRVRVAQRQREKVRRLTAGGVKVDPARRFVGGLIVSSSPPGAAVLLNDKHVGTTPVRLRRLPVGTYAVRVDLDGFERWSRAVQVSSGNDAFLRPTLRPERAVPAATPRASR